MTGAAAAERWAARAERDGAEANMDRGIVLVVEDDRYLRRLLRDLLLGECYGVVEAEDALEAMQALNGRPPDDQFSVVLLDMMPPHDGVQVLRRLAERNSPTAVVAMSASDAGLAAPCPPDWEYGNRVAPSRVRDDPRLRPRPVR
jgi:CheY-like chemotaxis protein